MNISDDVKSLVESFLGEETKFKNSDGTKVTIKQDGNGYYWSDGQREDPARWETKGAAKNSYFDQLEVNNNMSENKLSELLLTKFYELDTFIKDNNIDLDVPYNQMRADPMITKLANDLGMDEIDFLDQYIDSKGK